MAYTIRLFHRTDRDPKPWWCDIRGLPDGIKPIRKKKLNGRTKREAWEEADKLARSRMEGQREEVPLPTLDEFFSTFLDFSRDVGFGRGPAGPDQLDRIRVAYHGTNGDAGWIAPRYGDRRVDEFSAEDFDDLVAAMRRARKEKSTISQTVGVVSRMLKLAKRYGYRTDVPEAPPLRDKRPKRTAYQPAEAARILDEAQEWNDRTAYLVVLLGLHAGLYPSEMMGLDRDDVDFRLGCLHVRRKADDNGRTVEELKSEYRTRDVPMTPTLEAALREHVRRIPVGVPFVIFRRVDGEYRRFKKNWIRSLVRPVFKRAGLAAAEPFYRMRRTFATECKRPSRRIPDVLVARWMGHEEKSVTDRHYVGDLPMDEQREMIALLEVPPEMLRSRGFGGPVGGPRGAQDLPRKGGNAVEGL